MSESRIPLLWLLGPIGVGKSSVGWEIYSQLRKAGTKSGYVDADQMGLCDPPPEDDPVNQRVKSRNAGAVLKTYQEARARCLILTGSAYSHEEVEMYKQHFPDVEAVVCMLTADRGTVSERFLKRGWEPKLVEQATQEAVELDQADFADMRVDTSGHSVKEVAHMVQRNLKNWPGQ